ncbi:MAG: TRAP transporter substrate-binding protein [Pseudomonadota bacterium]
MVLGLVMGAVLLSRSAPQPAAQWDLSLPWAPAEFHTKNAIRFAAAVKSATEGRVQITVHPGAVLGIKGPDSLRAVEQGVVAMAEMSGFQQVGSEPILGLEALPFLIDDMDELALLYRDFLRPSVEAAFARYDLKLLYIVPWPNQNLFTKAAQPTLDAFRGLKVRTLDKNTTDLMDRLGFIPIQMPSPDVVPALASGAIDATMTSTTTGAAQKYWEFLGYTYRTNHGWASNMMVVSGRAWKALSAADQAAIEGLARQMEPEFWAISKADDARQLKVLEAQGMQTIVPDAQMAAQMRAIARPMWQDFAATVPGAHDILTGYLAATGRAPLEPPQ